MKLKHALLTSVIALTSYLSNAQDLSLDQRSYGPVTKNNYGLAVIPQGMSIATEDVALEVLPDSLADAYRDMSDLKLLQSDTIHVGGNKSQLVQVFSNGKETYTSVLLCDLTSGKPTNNVEKSFDDNYSTVLYDNGSGKMVDLVQLSRAGQTLENDRSTLESKLSNREKRNIHFSDDLKQQQTMYSVAAVMYNQFSNFRRDYVQNNPGVPTHSGASIHTTANRL